MEGVIVMVFVSYFAIKAMLLIIYCKYKVGKSFWLSPKKSLNPSLLQVLSVLYQYENLTEDLEEDVKTGDKKRRSGGDNKVLPLKLCKCRLTYNCFS